VGYAVAPAWALFPPFALVWGLGSGAIDSALNGYATRHYSVRHVNWLHACWSVGATLGPVIMTAALSWTGSYRGGYAGIAGALAAMGVAFAATRRSWDDQMEGSSLSTSRAPTATIGAFRTLESGLVWLQITLFFTYTGLEAGAGQWCFTVLREQHDLGVEAAGAWTAAFWASLLAGRVAGGFLVDRVGSDRLLRLSAFAVVAGALAFASGDGAANRVGLIVLAGALAPVYPTLMARTPTRLGRAASVHAIGFQVSAATLGAAALPTGLGVITSRAGLGVVAPAVAAVAVVFLALHELLLRVTPRADR
jgi:fucose permease